MPPADARTTHEEPRMAEASLPGHPWVTRRERLLIAIESHRAACEATLLR